MTKLHWSLLAAAVCSCVIVPPSNGAKILVVPGNLNSHIMYFGRMADSLAELGHTVHILVPSNAKVSSELVAATKRTIFVATAATNSSVDDAAAIEHVVGKLTIERYAVDGDVPFVSSPLMSETMIEIAMTSSMFSKFYAMIRFFNRMQTEFLADCASLLGNSALLDRVRSTGYDFAIMDPAFAGCYVLPYATRIPYTASLSVPFAPLSYRVPRLPSYVSDTGLADRMSFFERLATFGTTAFLTMSMFATSTEFSERFAADRPAMTLSELLFETTIWLYLEDPALMFPRPLMPNTIQVGDIMTGRPARPLPADLDQFLADHASGGVLVVSFGSFLDHVPDAVLRMFCDAFAGLDASIGIVWKQTNPDACGLETERRVGAGRLRIMSWIPQNDLLADRRVRVFVTHGGLNSLVESAYHGKPVVVVPISLDQPSNAAAAVAHGFGLRVELSDSDFAGSLQTAIRTVLDDPSYDRQAKFAAALIADRRETPGQRASAALEHVIKYGDRHLRTGAFELNMLQFLMFDVFAALTAGAVTSLFCLGLIGRTAWRRCCCAKKTAKKKRE